MNFLREIIGFGETGSRKAQAFALGAAVLLTAPQIGLEKPYALGVAALAGVYILGRAIHDYALEMKTKA